MPPAVRKFVGNAVVQGKSRHEGLSDFLRMSLAQAYKFGSGMRSASQTTQQLEGCSLYQLIVHAANRSAAQHMLGCYVWLTAFGIHFCIVIAGWPPACSTVADCKQCRMQAAWVCVMAAQLSQLLTRVNVASLAQLLQAVQHMHALLIGCARSTCLLCSLFADNLQPPASTPQQFSSTSFTFVANCHTNLVSKVCGFLYSFHV